MREETAVAEVDKRGRIQLPVPLRKALKIEKGTLVRVVVSIADADPDPED